MSRKVEFPHLTDLTMVQNKLDILVSTARLMGYRVSEHEFKKVDYSYIFIYVTSNWKDGEIKFILEENGREENNPVTLVEVSYLDVEKGGIASLGKCTKHFELHQLENLFDKMLDYI